MSESFYLLKEKIIKTDAVITLIAEKSNKIKELEEKLKMLYKRYMDKSKENEALHHQAKICELEHRPLKDQIKELETRYSQLELKHNSLLNASEIKYQSLGVELDMCRVKYEKLLGKNKQLQMTMRETNFPTAITKRNSKHSEIEQHRNKLAEKVDILRSQVIRLSKKSDKDDAELNYFRTYVDKIKNTHGDDVVPKSLHVKELDDLNSRMEQMRRRYIDETNKLKAKADALEAAEKKLEIQLNALKLKNESMSDRMASLSVENDCMENLLQVNASSRLTQNGYESNSLEIKIDENDGLRWSQSEDDVDMECVDDIFNEMIDVPSFMSPFRTSYINNEETIESNYEEDSGEETQVVKLNNEEEEGKGRDIACSDDDVINIVEITSDNEGEEIGRDEPVIDVEERIGINVSIEDERRDRIDGKQPHKIDDKQPDRINDKHRDRIDNKQLDRINDKQPHRIDDKQPNCKHPDKIDNKHTDRIDDKQCNKIDDKQPERIDDKQPNRIGDKQPDANCQDANELSERISESIKINNEDDIKSNVEINSDKQETIKKKIGIPEITITPPTPPTIQLGDFCFGVPISSKPKSVALNEESTIICNKQSDHDLNSRSEKNEILSPNLDTTITSQDNKPDARRIKIVNAAIKRKKVRLWNNKVKALKRELFISVVKYVNRKFSMGQKRPYGINLLEIQKSKFNDMYRSRKLRMMRWKLLRESNTYSTDTESDICRKSRLRTRKIKRRAKSISIDAKNVDNLITDASDDTSRFIANTEQEYKEITANYNDMEIFYNTLNDSFGTQTVQINETEQEMNTNDVKVTNVKSADNLEYEISSVDSGYFKSDSESFEVYKNPNLKTYGVTKKRRRVTAKENFSGPQSDDSIHENYLLTNVPLISNLCVADAFIDDKIDQLSIRDSNSDSKFVSAEQLFGSDCSLMSIDDLNVTEELNSCGVTLDNIEMFSDDFVKSYESFISNEASVTNDTTNEQSKIDVNCTKFAERSNATSLNKKKCKKRKYELEPIGDELQKNTNCVISNGENNCNKQTIMETRKALQRHSDSTNSEASQRNTFVKPSGLSKANVDLEFKNLITKRLKRITKNSKALKHHTDVDSPQAKIPPLNAPSSIKNSEALPTAETSLAALEKRLKEDDGCESTIIKGIRIARASTSTGVRKLKRPNCSKRLPDYPKSPEPQVDVEPTLPKIIPLNTRKPMSSQTANRLFERILCFPNQIAVIDEVADCCKFQDKDHLSRLIISKVSKDVIHKPDMKYTPPAPVLTETQRIFLGLMNKLDGSHLPGFLNAFMCQAEQHLLFKTDINCLQPVTRLYLAVCKYTKDIDRMRRMICDGLYFMDNLVVPFLFTVLSTWIELLPLQVNSSDEPIMKVLIQVVNLKTCGWPGYNLINLRKLLNGYYGYPMERGNSNEIFQDLFKQYLRTPTKSIEYSLLIMCKNHPTKWVFEQIDSLLKPAVKNERDVRVRIGVLGIIGYVLKQFDPTIDAIVLKNVEIWLKVLRDDASVLDVKEYVQKAIEMIPNS